MMARQRAGDGSPWVFIRSGSEEDWVSEGHLRSSEARKAVPRSQPAVVRNTAEQTSPGRSEPGPAASLPLVEPSPGASLRRPGKPYPTANVAARQLDVRQGPGAHYPPVGGLFGGALVRMTARQRAADGSFWVLIRAGSTEGWVSERELRIHAPTAKTRTQSVDTVPAPGSWARVATTLLNVRAGPGVDNGVVGRIARGTNVRVFERQRVQDDAIWTRIQFDALRGWVNAKHLEAVR